MTQHTPGPWENGTHSAFVYSKHGNVCACGEPRASKYVGYTECSVGSPDLGEAVANACLIAAAPDMLAALQTAKEVIDGHFDDNCEECMAAHGAICAAIAKATGAKP